LVSLPIPSPTIAGYKLSPTQFILVAIGAAALGYFAYKKFVKGGAQPGQMVQVAPDVQFALSPSTITPNVPCQLLGQFQDEKGIAVTVPQGYYYVFILDSLNNRRLVSQGSLGLNVSKFSVTINTTNWQQGKYNVVVTDIPLSPAELQASGVLVTTQPSIPGTLAGVQMPQPPFPLQPQIPAPPAGTPPPGFPVPTMTR